MVSLANSSLVWETSGLTSLSSRDSSMPQRFTILETLEEDSISSLVRADDDRTKAEVVVRRFKNTDATAKEGLVSLFSALQTLGHDNIEIVHEVGEDDEGVFILTTEPKGETLPKILERGPLSAEEFSALTDQLLLGLSAVHDQAIMHGALRAEHIRIDAADSKNWKVRIHGFGLGFGPTEEGVEPSTEVYLCAAPEQWEAGQARRRTDVYALGCILYQAAAARAPFSAKTLKELRHKHIQHDVRPLAKLAPQIPAWASAWVMRLLAVDADERPRKASIAKELYEQKDAAPKSSPPAKSDQGRITQAVSATGAPQVQGTQPLVRSTASVVASAGRPGSATSGTIAVPLGQTGQAAIPAVVGRPVRARTPAAQVAPPSKPSISLPHILGIGAVVIVGILIVVFAGGEPEPDPAKEIAWGKVGNLLKRKELQPPRQDALPYPPDRPAPVGADRLLLHYRADVGVEDFSGTHGSRPAELRSSVAVWGDLGPINRDNELAHFPWVPERSGITLTTVAPSPANGLKAPRAFIDFLPKDAPISCLNIAACGDLAKWPFGTKAKPGLTLAMVFVHPKANLEHLMASVRGKKGAVTVRFDKNNDLRLFAGQFGQDLPPDEKATPMPSRDVDVSVPSILIFRWRADPQRIHYTLTNAKGQRFESITEARNFSPEVYDSFSIGGGPPQAYTNPKTKIVPFRGSIAEVLVYPSELSDADMTTLETQLKGYYFK